MSKGCTKTNAPTALIVSAFIKSFASAPKSILVATDANAKYKLKLISDITFDSKKPLYIAAKSKIFNEFITLFCPQGFKASSDTKEREIFLIFSVVHGDPDAGSIYWISDTLGEKGRYHRNEHSLGQQSKKTA